MHTTNPNNALVHDGRDDARWPIAGLFLEALSHRDFTALASYMDPDINFRALIPPGPVSSTGASEAAQRFQGWFGGTDVFEVVDASIGQLGPRLYLRWRVRMHPQGHPDASRVAEQHAFATVGELIESIDLVCSGFQSGQVTPELSAS